MPAPDDHHKQYLLRKAEELLKLSEDLTAKFAAKKAEHERVMRRNRFFSLNRGDFWHLPKWLWVSAVVSMVSMFFAALLMVR